METLTKDGDSPVKVMLNFVLE